MMRRIAIIVLAALFVTALGCGGADTTKAIQSKKELATGENAPFGDHKAGSGPVVLSATLPGRRIVLPLNGTIDLDHRLANARGYRLATPCETHRDERDDNERESQPRFSW